MIFLWLGFIALILTMLALDLGLWNKKSRAMSTGEALVWTMFWVVLSLLFNIVVYYAYENHWFGIGVNIGHQLDGGEAALQYFTGYIIEKTLSLDNIFIIAFIFSYYKVPLAYQHRVLMWGVLGALVMRFVMIILGVELITRFDWMIYVFGAILIFTAVKMLVAQHDNLEPENNSLIRLARKWFPISPGFHEDHFFIKLGGKWMMTPLLLVLIQVESADLLFAVDSIPAIFAITQDPFIIFTSNVFAILGLRSLYFALAGLMEKFRYLKTSLVFVLAFVGVKMLLTHSDQSISNVVSLFVIVGILAVGVLASIVGAGRDTTPLQSPIATGLGRYAELTRRQAKKIIVLAIGGTVLLIGIAMVVLPGPAMVVIPLGLAILAKEFMWARNLLNKIKEKGLELKDKVFKKKD